MPAMCYYGQQRDCGSWKVCWTDIQSPQDEMRFLYRAKEMCEFFGEMFDPGRVERYLPWWETEEQRAKSVKRFDWDVQLDLFI